MKYKCIIFDCDGVLVDSEEISIKVLTEMVNSLGKKIDLEYAVENLSGKSLKSVFEFIENLIGGKLPDHFEKEFRRQSFESFKTDLKPVDGIHDLLDKLSVPYCVASSGPIEKIRLNLTVTNLIGRFEDRIYSSYDIGSWKPNPEIFEYAAAQMGFKPRECAVIEDSLAGIRAAKKGGFDVFGFAKPKNKLDFEKEGAVTFFEMGKLYELLIE